MKHRNRESNFGKDFSTGCGTIALILFVLFVGIPLLFFFLKISFFIAVPVIIGIVIILCIAYFGRIVRFISKKWWWKLLDLTMVFKDRIIASSYPIPFSVNSTWIRHGWHSWWTEWTGFIPWPGVDIRCKESFNEYAGDLFCRFQPNVSSSNWSARLDTQIRVFHKSTWIYSTRLVTSQKDIVWLKQKINPKIFSGNVELEIFTFRKGYCSVKWGVNHGLDLQKFFIIIYGEPRVCFTWDGLIQARFSVFTRFWWFYFLILILKCQIWRAGQFTSCHTTR